MWTVSLKYTSGLSHFELHLLLFPSECSLTETIEIKLKKIEPKNIICMSSYTGLKKEIIVRKV